MIAFGTEKEPDKSYSICGRPIPASVISLLDHTLSGVSFGSVSVTVQDRRIVQVERTDRILVPPDPDLHKLGVSMDSDAARVARDKILEETTDLAYGQVIVRVQGGIPVQVEKTEKVRFRRNQGLDGEGI